MSDRGIIFSAPMVRALLDGRKTQTRRLCAWANNPNSPALTYIVACDEPGWFGDEEGEVQFRAPYAPGDRLYVRERMTFNHGATPPFTYAADGTRVAWANRSQVAWLNEYPSRGCPSIHMPRWASRLTLVVTDVQVQRLQEISEEDAEAEGIETDFWDVAPVARDYSHPDAWFVAWSMGVTKPCSTVEGDQLYRMSYATLWNSLHTKPGDRWEDNPWIVAVSFSVEHRNIDANALPPQ